MLVDVTFPRDEYHNILNAPLAKREAIVGDVWEGRCFAGVSALLCLRCTCSSRSEDPEKRLFPFPSGRLSSFAASKISEGSLEANNTKCRVL